MVSIVLPAYQEAENLRTILPELTNAFNDSHIQYEILVIDTIEATDNTQLVCEEYRAIYKNREGGNYYGDAIRSGFKNSNGNYIIVMDADGSHRPEDAVRLYEEMIKENCDVVIGSRYCKGGFTENSSILKLMSWCLNVTYRFIFGLKVKDVSDSFRIYKAEQIKRIELECDNFDIVEEILIKMSLQVDGFTAKEIPISFCKRSAGVSKRDLKKFIFSYLQTICRLLKIKHSLKRFA